MANELSRLWNQFDWTRWGGREIVAMIVVCETDWTDDDISCGRTKFVENLRKQRMRFWALDEGFWIRSQKNKDIVEHKWDSFHVWLTRATVLTHLMYIFRQDFGTLITRPSTFRLIYLPLATHRSATNIRISLSSERVSLDMTANETASTYYIQSGSLLGRSFATAYMGAKLDDLTISFSDAVNGLKQTYWKDDHRLPKLPTSGNARRTGTTTII